MNDDTREIIAKGVTALAVGLVFFAHRIIEGKSLEGGR